MVQREAGPARMMSTLGIAGFCSGLALVSVYMITQPRIARNRMEALEAAIFRVLPGARSREALTLRHGELTPVEAGDADPGAESAIYAGYDEAGKRIGFAIPAEGPGFQDTIKLIYGYDPERRRIVGLRVLESRETPGLGDKIIKDQDFVSNFSDLRVTPEVVVVRRGRTNDNEVDAISGATISSNAVVKIINQANARWLERLPTAAAPPPASPGAATERD
ncbi:MAG: FMN-binding protein [Myxococcales bacterium]|nr:FMN-binding protein [Myxococcales bacterium]